MTAQQAIRIIQEQRIDFLDESARDLWNDAVTEAIVALRRKIPVKPKKMNTWSVSGAITYDGCPECHCHVKDTLYRFEHCPNCGQRIDWS